MIKFEVGDLVIVPYKESFEIGPNSRVGIIKDIVSATILTIYWIKQKYTNAYVIQDNFKFIKNNSIIRILYGK